MDALEALITRASAVRLGEPAPSDADVADAFRAAARAPDHGLLRPWEFITIRGDARHALGEVMSAAAAAHNLGIVFHAKGFGTMWRTGAMAYDVAVKRALGLDAHDHIVAIQYVGTPEAHSPDDWRVDPADFVTDWTGVPPD
jgi:nitroreductase